MFKRLQTDRSTTHLSSCSLCVAHVGSPPSVDRNDFRLRFSDEAAFCYQNTVELVLFRDGKMKDIFWKKASSER